MTKMNTDCCGYPRFLLGDEKEVQCVNVRGQRSLLIMRGPLV